MSVYLATLRHQEERLKLEESKLEKRLRHLGCKLDDIEKTREKVQARRKICKH